MKLSQQSMQDTAQWSGYSLPKFDINAVRAKTYAQPTWVHFGAGNIFRAFPAAVLQKALDSGAYDRGVIVAEGFDYEIIDKAYRPYDNMSLLVLLKSDGQIEKQVVASVTESLKADPQFSEDWNRLVEIFRNPSLQMISFTITEKGYGVNPADLERGMNPVLIMGKVTGLLYERFKAGKYPLTVQSMDNCSHNGDKVKAAVLAYAGAWVKAGLVPEEFLSYVQDPALVTYPWSMIDKITPRPDAKVQKMLADDGFEDNYTIITDRHTYTAPFVNAEETEYLVIEDDYTNGRPPLDLGGVRYADRETVDKVEKMKVCTCLNPLHTALAIFGCLLGYTLINEEMKDPNLLAMVRRIGYDEGLPVAEDPGILSPRAFLDEVINERFPNPFLPDSPQRIACDTSQKLPVRFGVTVKSYLVRDDMSRLKMIPFVFSGWCRYLLGVDDEGNPFEVSPDPMLEELRGILGGIRLGDAPREGVLMPIYSNAAIFGVDLYSTSLAKQIEDDFWAMVQGPGMVRKMLQRKLEEFR